MRTRFYKILYKGKDVVYVGVTTRAITERFKEHLITKNLNENYSVVEFDCVEHPVLTSLETYYEERRKIVDLEQKYIKEELERGSHLFNISKGGEWGSQILEKLRKEEFYKKFGSYDNYVEYKKKTDKIKGWIEDWTECCGVSKSKRWVQSWVRHRSEVRTRKWLQHWIECRSTNETVIFLRRWCFHRSEKRTKRWLQNWVFNKSQQTTVSWLRRWVVNRSTSMVKVWMRNWVNCRTRNKVKVWMRNWITHRYNFDNSDVL